VEKDPKDAAGKAKGWSMLSFGSEQEIDMSDCHVAFRRDTIGIVQQNREIYPDSGDSKQACAACCACLGICTKIMKCNIFACLRKACCSCTSAQDRHNKHENRRARAALSGPSAYASETGRAFNLPRIGISSVDFSTYADSIGLADTASGCCCCPGTNRRIKDLDWSAIQPEHSKAPLELQVMEMPERIITLGLRNVVLPGRARACDAVLRLYVSGIVHVDALLKIVRMLHRNADHMRDAQYKAFFGSSKDHRQTAWVNEGGIGDQQL